MNKIKNFGNKLFISFVLAGFLGYFATISSCASSGDSEISSVGSNVEIPDLSTDIESLNNESSNIEEDVISIDASADSIDVETDQIRSSADPVTRDAIEPNLSAINKETRSIRTASDQIKNSIENLGVVSESLEEEQEKADTLASSAQDAIDINESLVKENEELKSEAKKILNQKMAWIGVISVFGIGIAIVLAFLTRSRAATLVAIGFVVTLGISIAVSMYMSAIGIITVVIAGLATLGVLTYLGYNLFVQNKATDELVHTGEVTKNYLSPEAKRHIFGEGPEPGVADQIQSQETKKMVKKVRKDPSTKRRFDLSKGDSLPALYSDRVQSSGIIPSRNEQSRASAAPSEFTAFS